MKIAITNKKFDQFTTIVLIAFSVFHIFFRYELLRRFSTKLVDSDEVLMWLGTRDFSEGSFHEPRFYGQAYNTMMESFLAVPLFKFNVPLYIAVPIVTSLLAVVPFFVLAYLVNKYKSRIGAIFILLIPFLLPLEYDLITSLPRGFVTGIAVASACFYAVFKSKNWAFFLSGFACILAYSVNANSILITIPCLFYQLLLYRNDRKFYLIIGAGILSGLLIHFWVQYFYSIHSNYIVHAIDVTYGWNFFWKGLSDINFYFSTVSPFPSSFAWGLFVVPLVIAVILLIKKKYAVGLVILSLPFIWLLPLFASKIHDATNSVYFSAGRMFLAVPIGLSFIFSFFSLKKRMWLAPALFLFFGFGIFKWQKIQSIEIQDYLNKSETIVGVKETKTFLLECKKLTEMANENRADLILINNYYGYDFYNYGCSACEANIPKTLRPGHERRTWRLIEDEKKVYRRILIMEIDRHLDKEYDFVKKIPNEPWLYTIENNHVPTKKLLIELKIPTRSY